MQSNLYIPKKITVGFQKRSDTYTGKLGFVTYTDDKGVFRQENSWNGWRDKKIAPIEVDNVPSRFVFNKDVSRSGHWSDVTKVRIYDTRDFEFEIDVSNMMYILMHSDISKRDIIEECVFAWSGKNLTLIPVNSEEYRNSVENTRKLNTKFSLKDLVLGYTYSTKKFGDVVYLGSHEWSEKKYSSNMVESVGKKHIFYVNKKYYDKFLPLTGSDLVEAITNEVHSEYATLVDQLYKSPYMKKSGKFTIKKGFDSIGFKKTAYSSFKVEIKGNHFDVNEVELYQVNGIPKFKKESNYWTRNDYEREMKEKKINIKDMNQVKDFFESKGFGELYYTDENGNQKKFSN